MATYNELFDLRRGADNNDLLNRTAIAAMKKADALIAGATPTAAEVAWADSVLSEPDNAARKLLPCVLASNSALSVAAITALTDAALQSTVDTVADVYIAAGLTV